MCLNIIKNIIFTSNFKFFYDTVKIVYDSALRDLLLAGNEKVIEDVIKTQHLRLAKLPAAERTLEMINTLYLADVESLKVVPNEVQIKRNIGFKQNG
jgi:hypothetical protein